ncbi:MAG: hypothetical protein P4L82_12090 [Ancalomicrobiaceae bacterium]|nr:hypothetical protein [Ancalomicrobiaceae bacterium]
MQPLFTRSVQTKKLVALFQDMSIDTQMSFAEAGKRLGFALTSSSDIYRSARWIATRDHQIVIEGIRGFGFTRLAGSGIVKRGDGHERAIRRRARRASTEMTVAITQNLTRDDMQAATEKLSRFRIIADLSTPARASSNKPTVADPEPHEPVDVRAQLGKLTGFQAGKPSRE